MRLPLLIIPFVIFPVPLAKIILFRYFFYYGNPTIVIIIIPLKIIVHIYRVAAEMGQFEFNMNVFTTMFKTRNLISD